MKVSIIELVILCVVVIAVIVVPSVLLSTSTKVSSLAQICLLDVAENANLCWNSTTLDYCRYPISLNLTGPGYYNLSEIFFFVEETLGNQYELNLENGCFTTASKKRNVLDYLRAYYTLDRFIIVLSLNSSTTISIPISSTVNSNGTYTCSNSDQAVIFEINWGDESENDFIDDIISSYSVNHTYFAGNYTITIGGAIYSWSTFCGGDSFALYLTDILQYGDVFAYHLDLDGSTNLRVNVSALDSPNPLIFFSRPTIAPTQVPTTLAPTEAPTVPPVYIGYLISSPCNVPSLSFQSCIIEGRCLPGPPTSVLDGRYFSLSSANTSDFILLIFNDSGCSVLENNITGASGDCLGNFSLSLGITGSCAAPACSVESWTAQNNNCADVAEFRFRITNQPFVPIILFNGTVLTTGGFSSAGDLSSVVWTTSFTIPTTTLRTDNFGPNVPMSVEIPGGTNCTFNGHSFCYMRGHHEFYEGDNSCTNVSAIWSEEISAFFCMPFSCALAQNGKYHRVLCNVSYTQSSFPYRYDNHWSCPNCSDPTCIGQSFGSAIVGAPDCRVGPCGDGCESQNLYCDAYNTVGIAYSDAGCSTISYCWKVAEFGLTCEVNSFGNRNIRICANVTGIPTQCCPVAHINGHDVIMADGSTKWLLSANNPYDRLANSVGYWSATGNATFDNVNQSLTNVTVFGATDIIWTNEYPGCPTTSDRFYVSNLGESCSMLWIPQNNDCSQAHVQIVLTNITASVEPTVRLDGVLVSSISNYTNISVSEQAWSLFFNASRSYENSPTIDVWFGGITCSGNPHLLCLQNFRIIRSSNSSCDAGSFYNTMSYEASIAVATGFVFCIPQDCLVNDFLLMAFNRDPIYEKIICGEPMSDLGTIVKANFHLDDANCSNNSTIIYSEDTSVGTNVCISYGPLPGINSIMIQCNNQISASVYFSDTNCTVAMACQLPQNGPAISPVGCQVSESFPNVTSYRTCINPAPLNSICCPQSIILTDTSAMFGDCLSTYQVSAFEFNNFNGNPFTLNTTWFAIPGSGQWSITSGSATIVSPNSFVTDVLAPCGETVLRWSVMGALPSTVHCPNVSSTVTFPGVKK